MFSIKELQAFTDSQLKAMESFAREALATEWATNKEVTLDQHVKELVERCQVRARMQVKITDTLISLLESTCYTHHYQIYPETLEWGGFLSGDSFNCLDEEKESAIKKQLIGAANIGNPNKKNRRSC